MPGIKRIMILVDFSPNSERAVAYGLDIARDKGAAVYLLHMINQRIIDAVQELCSKGYKGDFIQNLKKLVADRERDLREYVPADLQQGLDIQYLIRKGEPAEEVANLAKEFSVDLIVLGSHGTTGLATTFIGSVAQSVVSRAPCPVLLVRPVEHDFPVS